MSNDEQERRKLARLNILVDVTYAKKDSPQAEKLTLIKNIGKGGICFVGYEALRESDVIDINIYLPEAKAPLKATGKVTWVKEFVVGDSSKGKRYDVGLEFIDINEEDLAKIDTYVSQHLA